MLKITIPAAELWDEVHEEFIYSQEQTLQLEHSLVSLSKWESKWCKAFLTKNEKSIEETIDYIKCMTITQNVDPKVYNYITNENFAQINKYIEAPMTAIHFSDDKINGTSRVSVTSELIYYWMISLSIPVEFQKWHLNKLLALIKVCNYKNQPAKKRSSKEIMSRNSEINASRRKQLNTSG